MTFQEHSDDSIADRRRRLDRDQLAAFDAVHGPARKTGAGKGDADRTSNKELYDAGYESTFGATEEIRAAALQRWEQLRRNLRRTPDQEPTNPLSGEFDESEAGEWSTRLRPNTG